MKDDEKRKAIRELAKKITQELSDQGKIIQGGWRGYELVILPEQAGPIQREEMRKAFFAGAQHLWASIMVFLDEGSEPTEKDLRRMSLIHKELDDFIEELKRAMI